jgi:hypothetical protein
VAQELVDERDHGWADGSWRARPWAGGSIVDGSWLGDLSEVDHSGHRVIELGDRVEPPPPSGPARPSRLRLVLAIAAVCLYVLSGATVASADGPSLLWTVQLAPVGPIEISGDSVYVATPGSAPTVLALDRVSGRIRWRVNVPWTPQRYLDLGNGLDAIVVRTTTVDSTDPSRDTQTLFVRRSDGRVVAQAVGDPVGRVGDLTLQVGSVRRCPLDASSQCVTVSAVDPGTGRAAWSRTLPPGGRVMAGGETSPGRFVTADPDGTLTLRSGATGAALATVPGNLSTGGGIRLSAAVGGVLVVGVAGTAVSTFVGYRAASLQPLWSVDLTRESKSDVDTSLVGLARCGQAVCVSDRGGTVVLDPASGALRFRTPLQVVTEVDGGAFVALPLLGHLDALGHYVSDVLTLDRGRGTTISTIVDATLVDAEGHQPTALIWRAGAHRTDFAAIGPGGSGAELLSVAQADLNCTRDQATLVCADDSGLVRAWSL